MQCQCRIGGLWRLRPISLPFRAGFLSRTGYYHPMKFVLIFCALFLTFSLPAPAAPPATGKANLPDKPHFLIAHYMPWFEAKPFRQDWGWHWTMNHFHPDKIVNGRQEIASRDIPLMGLYDSSDPQALDCQVLLMKAAGIDGVLIDWYGLEEFNDYPGIQKNTLAMIQAVKKAGLRFALVYEDQPVRALIAGHVYPEADAVAHGQQMMAWLQAHWFSDPAYLTWEDRPVFLTFGDGYYQSDQWKQIFAGLPKPPLYFTEEKPRPPAEGAFDWPQPTGGTAPSEASRADFYKRAPALPYFIPAAWPRFDDSYADAGLPSPHRTIDDKNGLTYTESLAQALQSKASIVQLVTWNDWGEGTQIEPSVEFGYRDLEVTQRGRRKYWEPNFPRTPRDLHLPLRLYNLQKKAADDPARRAKLEAISHLLFAGKWELARAKLTVYGPIP